MAFSAFMFLLATEFFAYASSVSGQENREQFIFFDLAAFTYNAGLASLAASLLILFYSIGLIFAVYVVIGFIIAELLLMVYFLTKAFKVRNLFMEAKMKVILYSSIFLYILTLAIIIAIVLFASYIIGLM